MGSCDNVLSTLKRRLTIQNSVLVADGQGGFTETWQNESTVWASIEPVKGWERMQAAQAATPITHKIVTRYTRAVTTTSRVKFGDRYFGVKEVLNRNEDSRYLDIRAVELESVEFQPDSGALLLRSGGFLLLRGGGNILLRA